MSGKVRRAAQQKDAVRIAGSQHGEEGGSGPPAATACPECGGRCYDKHGIICAVCFGEGEI